MSEAIDWKRFGIALLAHVPVVLGAYTWWYFRNYWHLGKLPDYKRIAGSAEDVAIREAFFSTQQQKRMQYRVVDLDGALLLQKDLILRIKPEILSLRNWGPPLRLDCSFKQFWEFEKALSDGFGADYDDDRAALGPIVTFYGSNDFHHLSLALIRRFRQPFNLVLFDNHPDWVERYPGLHCGSWFNHACELPTVQQAFHIGGHSGEFEDTELRFFTPWKLLISGKIFCLPADRKFKGMKWNEVKQENLRTSWHKFITRERVRELLQPYAEILRKYPLYITLDKDVMIRGDNLQNWNSGALAREEVIMIIEELISMSGGRLLALDITGDFSKVEVEGVYRAYLHRTQHDDVNNNIDPETAAFVNEKTNFELLKHIAAACNADSGL